MTRVEDLTAAELRQVRTGRATTSAGGANPRGTQKAGTPRPATRASQLRAPAEPIWACHDCAEPFTALAAGQRHCDETGHHRLDWIAGRKEQP